MIGFFRFLTRKPVWRFLLLVIVTAVLIWQWTAITAWADNVATSTARLFGWGLVFIFLAVITLAVMALQQKLQSLTRRTNRWLGAVAFILFIWGIFSFIPGKGTLAGVSLGGKFGQGIIGYTGWVGIFRLLGLLILGTVLTAPH
ncbi:MAG: hypothetical protein V3S02_04605, partial [Dehalococcoidales bacterium]